MRLWPRRRKVEFSHEKSLRKLRECGFAPRTIYDIGAYHGDWSKQAAKVFPLSDYILFEANAANEPWLRDTERRYFIVPLGAADGVERTFFVPKQAVTTGASFYRENTKHYSDDKLAVHQMSTQGLDSLVLAHDLPPPDLIKLDVQGAELDVLAGASAALSRCGALVAELSLVRYNDQAPLFAEVIGAIDRIGFRCADICEVNRAVSGVIWQIDMLFVNAALFEAFHERSGLV